MLVCLASVKGSPGTTSTALALAAVWPRQAVVVETDPVGGDLAYRCRAATGGPVYAAKGLLTLAAAVRGGIPGPEVIFEQSQLLACGVNLVQGVTSSGQARGLGGLWSTMAEACRTSEVDVIADLGRLDRGSAVLPLARAANVLLPVAATSLESVMHLTDALNELIPVLVQHRTGSISPVVVGPVLVGPDAHAAGDCVDLDDLLSRAGHPVAPTQPMAHDPRALERLEQGEKATGRLGRTLLLRRARAIALGITATVETDDREPDGQEFTAHDVTGQATGPTGSTRPGGVGR
jgi:hypothetical protein